MSRVLTPSPMLPVDSPWLGCLRTLGTFQQAALDAGAGELAKEGSEHRQPSQATQEACPYRERQRQVMFFPWVLLQRDTAGAGGIPSPLCVLRLKTRLCSMSSLSSPKLPRLLNPPGSGPPPPERPVTDSA